MFVNSIIIEILILFCLQILCVISTFSCTFFFTLVWQFAQFILLLQSMAFFGVYALGFAPKNKVVVYYIIITITAIAIFFLNFSIRTPLSPSFVITISHSIADYYISVCWVFPSLLQIRNLYLVVILSILSVCLMMFVNDMMLCSLALSFCIGALLLMAFQVSDMSCHHV